MIEDDGAFPAMRERAGVNILDASNLLTTADSPPWLRKVAARSSKCREATLARADGVVGSSHRLSVVERSNPSAPNKEASRYFLEVASTPLKELDARGVRPQGSNPFALLAIVVFGNVVDRYAFQVSQRRFRYKAAES